MKPRFVSEPGLFLFAPAKCDCTPSETCTISDEHDHVTIPDVSLLHFFVQANRDCGGRRIPVILDGLCVDTVNRKIKSLDSLFYDAEIGLMRYDEINIRQAYP